MLEKIKTLTKETFQYVIFRNYLTCTFIVIADKLTLDYPTIVFLITLISYHHIMLYTTYAVVCGSFQSDRSCMFVFSVTLAVTLSSMERI